jgi:hypothetical protein
VIEKTHKFTINIPNKAGRLHKSGFFIFNGLMHIRHTGILHNLKGHNPSIENGTKGQTGQIISVK